MATVPAVAIKYIFWSNTPENAAAHLNVPKQFSWIVIRKKLCIWLHYSLPAEYHHIDQSFILPALPCILIINVLKYSSSGHVLLTDMLGWDPQSEAGIIHQWEWDHESIRQGSSVTEGGIVGHSWLGLYITGRGRTFQLTDVLFGSLFSL